MSHAQPHTEVPSILHQRLAIIRSMHFKTVRLYNILWEEPSKLKLSRAEPSKLTTIALAEPSKLATSSGRALETLH